jgi:hypothetical protein
MATLTINQLVSEVRQNIDAESAPRWSDAEVITALSYAHEGLWSRILSAAPYYRFQSLSVATAADGTFPVASLSTGTGNDQKRFYRILSVNDGQNEYVETRFQDIPLGANSAYTKYQRKLYYLAGTNYQTLPVGTNSLTVVVNYKPTMLRDFVPAGAVSAYNIPIDWPEGSENVLVYDAASRLLMKGGAEANTAALFARMMQQDLADMLDDIRRMSINPTRMAYPDSAAIWGG